MSANQKTAAAPLAILLLAAGKGTRMRSDLPKVMHKLAGEPLIGHVARVAGMLAPARMVAVVAPRMESVQEAARKAHGACAFAVQAGQRGTGHAVLCAEEALKDFEGAVLILFGDTPLITADTLARMTQAARDADIAVLGMRPRDATGYGRLVLNASGALERIVECREASPAQKAIPLCNSGVMAVSSNVLWRLLKQVKAGKAGEYYLTDIIALARGEGLRLQVAEAPEAEMLGINSRAQLAAAEATMQQRLRAAVLENGATLIAPETVFLAADTRLGRDTVVHPFVVFGPGVAVGERAEIRSYSHIEQARIGADCLIGPFARLRPGAMLEPGAHIGNFVEIKQSHIGAGAKISHLAYVGDAEVGGGANIGAGAITCNYDGTAKHKTVIGAEAFIGSNASLVAPVSIGAGAVVGAGSVITQDVPEGALALERNEQKTKPGAAKHRRGKRA